MGIGIMSWTIKNDLGRVRHGVKVRIIYQERSIRLGSRWRILNRRIPLKSLVVSRSGGNHHCLANQERISIWWCTPLRRVTFISPFLRCMILCNHLLMLGRKIISQDCRLGGTTFNVLLYFYKAWIVLGKMILDIDNACVLGFSLWSSAPNIRELSLLGPLLNKKIFLFVLILFTSRLLKIFQCHGMHWIHLRGMIRNQIWFRSWHRRIGITIDSHLTKIPT